MPASGPISEGQRLALLNRLCEVLGEEEANTLMDSLPPVYWEQLATKGDLAASEQRLGNEMRSGFAKVYAELHSLHTETAAEFKNIRTETATEFKNIRTETAAEFAKVYGELHSLRTETAAEFKNVRSEMALQFAKQTRTMVFTMLGLAVPILGTILAVGLS
jgi:hypothetical protein